MEVALKKLFTVMPLIFGIGFIAPLIAQTMAAWHWEAPLGLTRIAFGLTIGAAWGLYATLRGRWV
ncbi:hypothetical protein [Novosphingobium sp. JCM 18896]|uniref:hypothetical protein n=1 Tax=Novosphingobium sp. JCM 18896 TaxID=2989731 RepID=UPI0022214004|nr:hypothetical protein [Novosphingobium sp. JCM 18896]MCW1427852.1 hypothetical protein [Novosphingobium sp. JCM 18896]